MFFSKSYKKRAPRNEMLFLGLLLNFEIYAKSAIICKNQHEGSIT